MRKNVLFYFEGAKVSAGTEVFMIDMAHALACCGYTIYVVDHDYSAVLDGLRKRGVKFEFVEYVRQGKIQIPWRIDVVFVTVYQALDCIRLVLPNDDCRVVIAETDKRFWKEEHRTCFGFISAVVFRRWKQDLVNHHAIALMGNGKVARDCGYQNIDKLVQLETPFPLHSAARVRKRLGGPWRFSSGGRAIPMKIYPVAYFFLELQKKFPDATFSYVTFDPEEGRKIFNSVGADFVQCVKGGDTNRLCELFDQLADCVIAIDGIPHFSAAVGLPSLCVATSDVWPYPYRRLQWVYARDDTMGMNAMVNKDAAYQSGETLDEIVEQLQADYERQSRECYKFIKDGYSLEKISESVARAVETTSLSFRDHKRSWCIRLIYLFMKMSRMAHNVRRKIAGGR